jgi:hypothetical protein
MTDEQLARAIRGVLLNAVDALERWMNSKWPGTVDGLTGELRKAYKARRNFW